MFVYTLGHECNSDTRTVDERLDTIGGECLPDQACWSCSLVVHTDGKILIVRVDVRSAAAGAGLNTVMDGMIPVSQFMMLYYCGMDMEWLGRKSIRCMVMLCNSYAISFKFEPSHL